MTSAKRTAAKPEDLDVSAPVDEVEDKSKVAKDPKAFRLYPNSTFATRGKRVSSASNKAVKAAADK